MSCPDACFASKWAFVRMLQLLGSDLPIDINPYTLMLSMVQLLENSLCRESSDHSDVK